MIRPVSSGIAGTPGRTLNGLLSPQYGPITSRRPSTAPGGANPASAPIQPVEELTFRRRYNPEPQGADASPAALSARRRSSNLPSPLFLAKNPSAPPMTHRSVSSTSSSSSSASRASEGSSSNYPNSAAQASLSRLLNGTKSPKVAPSKSPFFGAKSPSSATLKASTQLPRKSLPLGRAGLIPAPLSSNGLYPANRRISEPLSPYYSPSITSPNPADPFSSAFGGRATSYSSSRPTMSTSCSAPLVPGSVSPLASSAATTRPQDYSGFAGFLHDRHTRLSPTVSPTNAHDVMKHRASEGTESGYDAQDEELLQREKRPTSQASKKAASPVVSRRSLAQVSNGLRDAQQRSQSTLMKERLASIQHAAAVDSSASSSSSDGGHVHGRGKGYQPGRGGAFKGLLQEDEQEDGEQDEPRGRRSRQSTVKASQQADYKVTVIPTHKQPQAQLQQRPIDSALVTSSSASSSEEEENARGRGRVARAASSAVQPERRQLVSPFTALERAAAGLPHQQGPPPSARKASRDAAAEAQRGRMIQRTSSSEGKRTGSQTRSRSRTEARTSRRA